MKTKIYIVGFDETSNFLSDVYCMKKIKYLSGLDIKLDAVFTEELEKFLGVKKYCSRHEIDLININSDEKYFFSVVRYSINNLDKKNLATLISKQGALKLNWLFKFDKDFEPQII